MVRVVRVVIRYVKVEIEYYAKMFRRDTQDVRGRELGRGPMRRPWPLLKLKSRSSRCSGSSIWTK